MIQLCWMPTWSCQNYSPLGDGHNPHCPYCPLGVKNGRLTWNGKEGAANGTVDTDHMVDFLFRHESLFGSQLTISGGEPLASPALTPVIKRIANKYAWGITSNTTLLKPLAKLSEQLSGFASCRSWTASYHPFAHVDELFEQGVKFLRLNGARWVYCNIVASRETIQAITDKAEWLASLPFDRINILVDMYRQTELDQVLSIVDRYPGKFMAVGSGKTITGVNCHTLGRFLVVSPVGTIYQCVRKCYEEIDAIGNVRDARLNGSMESQWCSLDCPHTCDQIKHN